MKNLLKFLTAVALVIGVSATSYAQDSNHDAHNVTINIPEVALLDIEPSGSNAITLGPTAPTEAGDPLNFSNATNNTLWMNYSSIIGSTSEPTRTVSVSITTGTVPGGMNLKVVAASDAGGGAGNLGTPSTELTLSGTAQNIITGIGSCYTGNGTSKGHQLTYTLEQNAPANYGDLDFDDNATVLTVTYTISDN